MTSMSRRLPRAPDVINSVALDGVIRAFDDAHLSGRWIDAPTRSRRALRSILRIAPAAALGGLIAPPIR